MAAPMSHIMDEVMNERVALGGFNWPYWFLMQQLGGTSMALAAASRRAANPDLFDTVTLGRESMLQLWDAMGEGDIDAIRRILG